LQPTGLKRMCNLRRSIARRAPGFVKFLVSNARRLQGAGATGARHPVIFVPLGTHAGSAISCDIYAVGEQCTLSRKGAGARRRRGTLDASTLATAACASILFTDRWARVLRWVPSPASDSYLRGLAKRMLSEVAARRELANSGIVGVCAKSLANFKGAVLRGKVDAIVENVATVARLAATCAERINAGEPWRTAHIALCARGSPFPVDGYTTKFIPSVLAAMGEEIEGKHGATTGRLLIQNSVRANPLSARQSRSDAAIPDRRRDPRSTPRTQTDAAIPDRRRDPRPIFKFGEHRRNAHQGVAAALQHLVGDVAPLHPGDFCNQLLDLVLQAVRETWPRGVTWPRYTGDDVATGLCLWHQQGRPEVFPTYSSTPLEYLGSHILF
jgi:hypothetical protein